MFERRSNSARETVVKTTYRSVGQQQLTDLCRALGHENQLASYITVQDSLFEGWGDAEVTATAAYPSAIGDDHSPYEYSVAMSQSGLQLRILCEAQATRPSLAANHRAALLLNDRLAEKYGIALERFEQVRDLFEPAAAEATFSLWHAAILSPVAPPEFKLYLNPLVRGPNGGSALIREALSRLGLSKAAEPLFARVARSGSDRNTFNYFSLDLTQHEGARVKVYVAHQDATAEELDQMFEIALSHRRGDVTSYCEAIVGHRGPFNSKPMCSCFSFVEGCDVPTAATLHLPVSHYLSEDDETIARVSAYLTREGLPATVYEGAVRSLLGRSIPPNGRVQSYASYRREREGIRFTAYLSPVLFGNDERVQSSKTRIRSA